VNTQLHVPSFVVTLAGLLVFQGVMIELATIDKSAVGGVISVFPTSPVYKLVNSHMLPLIHIYESTRLLSISDDVLCLE